VEAEAILSKLTRYFVTDRIFFITTITHGRQHNLMDKFDELYDTITSISGEANEELVAWVLLPEHFHIILDTREANISKVMKRMKLRFSYRYRREKGLYRAAIWQRRFWDHVIRDQEDLNRHIDYIHYNPVKHGYVTKPIEWEFSSFREYAAQGYCPPDWGTSGIDEIDGAFGE
jgi:putative transposase